MELVSSGNTKVPAVVHNCRLCPIHLRCYYGTFRYVLVIMRQHLVLKEMLRDGDHRIIIIIFSLLQEFGLDSIPVGHYNVTFGFEGNIT